jgi:hypothetical protein
VLDLPHHLPVDDNPRLGHPLAHRSHVFRP